MSYIERNGAGYAGQAGEEKASGMHGAKVSSMCMPSQPQRWNEWSQRLEREERGNMRWREKWPSFKPEDAADLPWSTALRRNRDLTSPRGLGASANWSLPDATLLRSTITGLPVVHPLSPEPESTLPTLMQSSVRENTLLSKKLTTRHTRRPGIASMRSINSLSYDMLWDDSHVRYSPAQLSRYPCVCHVVTSLRPSIRLPPSSGPLSVLLSA